MGRLASSATGEFLSDGDFVTYPGVCLPYFEAIALVGTRDVVDRLHSHSPDR